MKMRPSLQARPAIALDFRGPGLAVISGLLLTAAFPKIDLPFLAFVALVPLMAAVADRRPGAAFRLGFLAGLAHYLTLLYWVADTMHTYGHLPFYLCLPVLVLLAAYLALYPAAFAAALAVLRPPAWALAPAAAAVWTALEFLRAVFLTGFPWALLGYSQYDQLTLIQVADITGVYGLSFFIVLINGGLWTVLGAFGGNPWQGQVVSRTAAGTAAAVCLAAAAGLWGYGHWRLAIVDRAQAAAARRTVAVVQGNIDQAKKWDVNFQVASVDKYLALSTRALADFPALVIWPETATPFYLFENPPLTEMVTRFVGQARTPFLIGSPSFRVRGAQADYYNSVYLLRADGTQGSRYDKVHLVPFGEYVPLKRFFPFLGKMVAEVGDFKPGPRGATLAWDHRRLGIQICYEIIFPHLSRQMVANGADLLVNVTNDAWFARTGAPYQHFSMAVLRAVENRRTLVRAANTGISGVIAPTGRVETRTDLFVDAAFSRAVPLMAGTTFYTRFGDLWAGLCLVAATAMLAVRRVKKMAEIKTPR